MANKEIILPVTVAGVAFKNPFYVASGPTARTVKQLLAIERAGWAGASLKLSMEPAPYINRAPRYALLPGLDALGFTAEKRLTADQGLALVAEARRQTRELVLLANITYAGPDGPAGWARMAKRFEEAGAHMIELNMCCPNMSFNVETTSGGSQAAAASTGASLGSDAGAVAAVTEAVVKAISIPLVVKLTPEGGDIGRVSRAAWEAGAAAVSGTANRLGMPPIDLEEPERGMWHLQEEPGMTCLCGGWLKPLAQRDTYEIRRICGPGLPIFATGGIRTARDALEMAMCGADLFGVCTETLMRGYDFIGHELREAAGWLEAHGHKGFRDIRDRMLPVVKAAPELTLHKGHAKVREPGRVAPCRAACPHGVDIQAVLRHMAQGDFEEAAGFAGGSRLCADCGAPCETACVKGRVNQGLGIKGLLRTLGKWAEARGIAIPAGSGRPRGAVAAKAREVLASRTIHGAERPVKPIDSLAAARQEAARCLKCGCGEGCGLCASLCCEFAVGLGEGGMTVDPDKCVACGMCFRRCPNHNIEMIPTGELV